MKKLLSLLLLAFILVASAACDGDKGDVAASKSQYVADNTSDSSGPAAGSSQNAPDSAEESSTPADDEQLEGFMGDYFEATRSYVNDLIGIGCRLDADWDVFDREQIAQLNGLMADLTNDEDIAEYFRSNGNLILFYAQKEDGLITLNITLEDLGTLYGSPLNEKQYADSSVSQIVPALESVGLSNVSTEIGSVTFAGKEHVAVFVTADLQGVDAYETLVYVKTGSRMAVITAASFLTNVTGDTLSLFYGQSST